MRIAAKTKTSGTDMKIVLRTLIFQVFFSRVIVTNLSFETSLSLRYTTRHSKPIFLFFATTTVANGVIRVNGKYDWIYDYFLRQCQRYFTGWSNTEIRKVMPVDFVNVCGDSRVLRLDNPRKNDLGYDLCNPPP